MNAKKTIKKILALGAGVTMVGATFAGALAYDLANYPAPFIQNGVFNGKIVLGEAAKSVDTIGALEIATSLQATAVTKEAVDVPGQAGEVNLGENAFRFERSNDMLEIRERMGNVFSSLTENELPALASGTVNAKATTTYDQYIRFDDGTGTLQPIGVNYARNKDRVDADYLVIDNTLSFFEWEIVFNQGLKSNLDGNSKLEDVDDEAINVFGSEYTFVNSEFTYAAGADDGLVLDLMSGSYPATLTEGETKTFTIDGVDYTVTLVFVSDPQTGTAGPQAKFSVNGQTTKSLSVGKTERLSGGLQIGVRDVLANPRAGIASIYLGADKVSFRDSDLSTNDFGGNCVVEVGDYELTRAYCEIDATNTATSATSGEVNVRSISYRLKANPSTGNTFYIPAGKGVREFMDEPQALFSPSFDVRYEGLKQVATTPIEITPIGDDEYWITATNQYGTEMNWPLVSSDGGTFRYGDDTDYFVFVEGVTTSNSNQSETLNVNPNAFNIRQDDYFLVWDNKADRSNSFVLTYDSIKTGTTKTISFTVLGQGKKEVTWTPDTTYANVLGYTDQLTLGGATFRVWIKDNETEFYPIAVDLNADGILTKGATSKFTVKGGGVLDFGYNVFYNSTNVTGGNPLFTAVNGHGTSLPGSSATNFIQQRLVTAERLFDQQSGNENVTWNVTHGAASDYELDLSLTAADIQEPSYLTGVAKYNLVEFLKEKSGDVSRTHTSFGALVELNQPSNNPEDLVIHYPEVQVGAQVFVVAGTVTRTEGGAGSVMTDVVNPISVGFAIFDSQAPSIGSENLIVVGGPCVNTVAAELMRSGADCTAGFVPGKALIKSFEQSGKVALLVAGYEGLQTHAAARVLANYGDYATKLKGAEVEVVAPSLSNIVVQAVTPVAPSE